MTSPLRRKRRTTLRLVLTLVSVASLAGASAFAQAEPQPPGRLPDIPSSADQRVRAALNQVQSIKQRSQQLLNVQAPIAPGVRSKGRLRGPIAGDDLFFEIETEPPSRERLFRLSSEEEVLLILEEDYRGTDPEQIFLMPGPFDRFDSVDSPTLGQMWFQNRETGSRDTFGRRGEMGVEDNRGIHPEGATAEAAISAETLGGPNMRIQLHFELASEQSKFGIVFRAYDPNYWIEAVDQIAANDFYYVVFSGTKVELWKNIVPEEEGSAPERTMIASADMPRKLSSTMTVYAFEDRITVYRDEDAVLQASDDSIQGEFAGVIALNSVDGPTRFDNFIGTPYGGPYEMRQFSPMASVFRGPNVHHAPLYFEQMPLERFGHHFGNPFQPVVAHTRFFTDVFLLSYSVGKQPPWKCHNSHGLPQPGDVVLPFRIYSPVWDTHGVGLQTLTTVLAFTLVP